MTTNYKFGIALRNHGYAKHTIDEYVRRTNQWLDFLINYEKVTDAMNINHSAILQYRNWMLEHGQSHRTINSKISTIYMFYKLAMELDLIEHNPAENVKYLRTSKPDTPRMTDQDVAILRSWFDKLQPNIRAAFYMIYGAGLRVGEAAHLYYSDVFVKNGALWVNVKNAKYQSDRIIPIMDQKSAQVVYDYKESEVPTSDTFFHITIKTIQWYARKFSRLYDMPFHVHMLRHNFATKLYEKGLPLPKIQRLLGHKSLSMTLYYVHHANQDITSIVPRFFKKDRNDNNQGVA